MVYETVLLLAVHAPSVVRLDRDEPGQQVFLLGSGAWLVPKTREVEEGYEFSRLLEDRIRAECLLRGWVVSERHDEVLLEAPFGRFSVRSSLSCRTGRLARVFLAALEQSKVPLC